MGIASRLRSETAPLHKATEAVVDLPGSVSSVAEYGVLLGGLREFYASAHAAMDDDRWRDDWATVGLDLADHERVALLDADLAEMGLAPNETITTFDLNSFDEALGCLYVVEGSSLGGKFLGPALTQAVGGIPTSFYDGDGREHPRPWRRVQAALAAFDESGRDGDAVVAGAVIAFEKFGLIVSLREVAK